jgi:hypothetical protein
MATTTTNYGFDIPQSTDLVKDGATAIATLGQDIDTAMNTALGTKKAGMVLLNTTSFSAVTSQSVNTVFSSSYDNYRIIIKTTASNDSVTFKLRVSGVDASTNYQYQTLQANSTTISGARSSAQTSFNIGAAGTNSLLTIELGSPAIAEQTTFVCNTAYNQTNNQVFLSNGLHSTATAYDGFTFACISNMTGSVSVYGYNK